MTGWEALEYLDPNHPSVIDTSSAKKLMRKLDKYGKMLDENIQLLTKSEEVKKEYYDSPTMDAIEKSKKKIRAIQTKIDEQHERIIAHLSEQ